MNLFSRREFGNPITGDLHSPLLADIDDGVRTLQKSLVPFTGNEILHMSQLT